MTSEDLFKEVILDHYKRPRNRRTLAAPTGTASRTNPTRGDGVAVTLEERDGTIVAVAFEGHGCSISQSSASMMTEAVAGQDRAAEVQADRAGRVSRRVHHAQGRAPHVERVAVLRRADPPRGVEVRLLRSGVDGRLGRGAHHVLQRHAEAEHLRHRVQRRDRRPVDRAAQVGRARGQVDPNRRRERQHVDRNVVSTVCTSAGDASAPIWRRSPLRITTSMTGALDATATSTGTNVGAPVGATRAASRATSR